MTRRIVAGFATVGFLIALRGDAQEASGPTPSNLSGISGQVTSALEAKGPNTYGTAAVSYVRVQALAFSSENSTCSYFGFTFRLGTSCLPTIFVAPLNLPSGAKIVSLKWNFNDTNAAATLTAGLVAAPDVGIDSFYPSAGAGPPDCISPGQICSGIAFAGGASSITVDLTPDNITVNNVNTQYYLEATTNATDGSQSTGAMVVGYVLQVSPAPVTATFADVPTSDFAFQFIEAFNAAGITVGCNASPPQFCPDRNVTRREMAVFFAKALGLQFP